MDKPVLVIGAGGFVGRKFVELSAHRGQPLIAISRRPVTFDPLDVEVHVREMCDPADYLPLLPRVRAVVHVASATTPGSSAGRPRAELEQNLRPTLALLEALQEHPSLPVVYTSSGGALSSRRGDADSDEYGAFYARSYHGAGKLAAEHFIEAWCLQFGGSAVVLRPSNLYGPGQPERPGFGIVPAAFGKIVRNEILKVWGDGSARRDFLYVDDFASLLSAAVDAAPSSGFRIFNACSGNSIELNTLLALIEQVTGRKLRVEYEKARAVDAPAVEIRASRAHEAFGWQAQTSLVDGLAKTSRWFFASHPEL